MEIKDFLDATQIDDEFLKRTLNINIEKLKEEYVIHIIDEFNHKLMDIKNNLFKDQDIEKSLREIKKLLNINFERIEKENSIKLLFDKKIILYSGDQVIDIVDYLEIILIDHKPYCIMYNDMWYQIVLEKNIPKLEEILNLTKIDIITNPCIKKNTLLYENNILVLSSVYISSLFGNKYEMMLFDYTNDESEILLQERYATEEEIQASHDKVLIELEFNPNKLKEYIEQADL